MILDGGHKMARRGFQSREVLTRYATADDDGRCAEIFLAGRRQAFPWRDAAFFRLGDYHDCVEGEMVWVAEVEGIVVGFISASLRDNVIHNLFIDPDWQNRGVGTRLLDCALSHMRRPVQLQCADRNEPARAFYERKGWVPEPPADPSDPYILYRK
ncbi:MAG TPA: GNAT family N-acetyltransferase [Azospirillaceae bacterium]|nr:GNAT family N-acetyltransferase [Azospirillaceae bacterium]